MIQYLRRLFVFVVLFVATLLILGYLLPYDQDGFMQAQADKMSALSDPDRESAIVLLGGSNVAFGYDSSIIADSLCRRVINAGLHAGLGMKYIIDDCFPHLRKDDLLVLSLEYGHYYGELAWGQSQIADMYYLNGFSYPGNMTIEQFRSILNNTPAFVRSKIEYALAVAAHRERDPVYRRSSFNEYGDACAHWTNDRPHGFTSFAGVELDIDGFNEKAFGMLIDKLNELKHRGVKILFFPPSFEKNSFTTYEKRIAYIGDRMAEAGYPFVSAPKDEVMTREYFYDTAYHLNHDGAIMHTLHLIKVITERFTIGIDSVDLRVQS